MATSGTPCGACKFLRRKCMKGCVFAPYFCHEQGASHFAAIHKVFGASNVSRHLTHLPVNYRCEAAVTISYEAQARLQDPIYGCVSHIFALQQQVVSLQAQLDFLKELQAAQANPNNNHELDHENLMRKFSQNQGISQFDANQISFDNISCYGNGNKDSNPSAKYENSSFPGENSSVDSLDSLESQPNNMEWPLQQDELLSLAFSYIHH